MKNVLFDFRHPPKLLDTRGIEMENMLAPTDYRQAPERIVAIEYQPVGPDGALLPHSVSACPTTYTYPRAWLGSIYDFDWCRRDQHLYYHLSGSGGTFYLSPMAEPDTRPRCAIWWLREATHPVDDKGRKLTLGDMLGLGYDILPAPVPILGFSPNPFDDASMDSVEWCNRCLDDLPTEDLCGHIWWCEKCGTYSKPSDRCKHRRPA